MYNQRFTDNDGAHFLLRKEEWCLLIDNNDMTLRDLREFISKNYVIIGDMALHLVPQYYVTGKDSKSVPHYYDHEDNFFDHMDMHYDRMTCHMITAHDMSHDH